MFNFFKNKIIFISDYDHTIGNLSEKLFYVIHKAKRENKQVVFIRKRLLFNFLFKIAGYKQLTGMYELESEYIYKNKFLDITIGSYWGLIFSVQFYFYALLKALKIKKKFEYKLIGKNFKNIINLENLDFFEQESVNKIDWPSIYEDKLEFTFSLKNKKVFQKNLDKLGLKQNEWFVCLHIRTSFYHKDNERISVRNSTPKNYRKMIEYINSIGGKVIRLGDPVDMCINNICIDYPNSEFKSELMDLYLIKNCKFYIGTNSGILDSAFLLGTPVLGVNFSDFCLTKGFKSSDKILYKHIYNKNSDSKLSLQEIFEQPLYVNLNINAQHLDKFNRNYFIEENSEDEILKATEEMIRSVSIDGGDILYDNIYDSIVKNAINRWITDRDLNIENKYRYFIRSFCNGQYLYYD